MNKVYHSMAQLNRDMDNLMEDRNAALRRAEAAEAEVARLKALLEAKQPYTPRVGDVVKVQEYRFVFTGPMLGDPDWFGNDTLRGWDLRAKRRDAWSSTAYFRYLRRATAEERAAAGLPVESEKPCGKCGQVLPEPPGIGGEYRCDRCGVPTLHDPTAQPQVLPEHLAWMEADAAWACSSWSTDFDAPENKKRYDEAILAARALRAAVARRDGGAK